MIFRETELAGAYVVSLDKYADERGFFARAWCRREFEENDLETGVVQGNLSLSRRKGTLRGLHYQLPPAAEAKLVRCIHGGIYDVILDLRPHSHTHGEWIGVELDSENRDALYVPRGFAHGFQTLTEDTEVFYLVTAFYAPEQERGVRYDDPAFDIEWPLEVTEISEKDSSWPDYEPEPALRELDVDVRKREVPGR